MLHTTCRSMVRKYSVFTVFLLFVFHASANACSLTFTSPQSGQTFSSPTITVAGTGSGNASQGAVGQVTATRNGNVFFQQNGVFTTLINFLGSGAASVTLTPGANVLNVSGSVSGCSASDSVVVFYDPTPVITEKNLGQLACGAVSGGNPINIGTGNKYQLESDYQSAGDFPLVFERTYNSNKSTFSERFGASSGWRHSYERSVTGAANSNKVVAYRADGKGYRFSRIGNSWQSVADVNLQLSATANGWLLTTEDKSVESYNANGQLQAIKNRMGVTQTLIYANGLLASVTDSNGRSLILSYDSSSRLTTLQDPANGLYKYAYNTTGNLVSVTYPDQTARSYLYNEAANVAANLPHALTGIIDENNQRFATFKYDAQNRAISTQHAGGAESVTVAYGTDSNIVTDALNTSRTQFLQTVQGVVKGAGSNQPGGSGCGASSSNVSYDANGNIAGRTDFNGHRINYSYDLTRNLEISRTEGLTATGASTPETRTMTTAWHPTFRLPVTSTVPGQETSWVYDSQGNITQKTLKDTATGKTRTWNISYTYSASVPGALLQKVENGPRTDVADLTTIDYYAPDAVCTGGHFGCRGQISQITNALGHATRITHYNAHGQPETIIDPNGLITTLSYDARQRLISNGIGSETTQFQYDNAGQLIQLTRADNSTLHYNYDAAHRLIKISDGLDNKIVYTLDVMGNRLHQDILDPAGQLAQTRHSEFDALSRLAKDIGANNQTSQYFYDSQGNLTDTSDPLNHTASNNYDALNRLIQHTNPANDSSQTSFDSRDNVTAVTDPNGNTTQYSYDGLDNLTREDSADRGVTNFTYDEAGNLKIRIDARGVKHTYTYDALNRLSRRAHTTVAGIPGSPDIIRGYDEGINGIGRLTSIANKLTQTRFTYGLQGRVLNKVQNYGSPSRSLNTTYDAVGHLHTQTYPSGLQIGYGYDAQGRVNSLSINGQVLLNNLTYQPFGPPKSWAWSNGQIYTRSFDTDGRLADYPIGSDTRIITYDAASRITAYSDNTAVGDQQFAYDLVDRLSTYSDNTTSQTYQYDANGNRTSQNQNGTTYLFAIAPSSNRLLTVQGPAAKTYNYDPAGNLTSDAATTFTWNAEGRLYQTTSGGQVYTYTDNGLGERILKNSTALSNGPYRFVYDHAGQLIGEYDKNNSLKQETVWLGDTPVAVVKSAPAAQQIQVYFIQADHLNAPRIILNNANISVWRWDHADAFGTTLPNEDPDGDGNTFEYNLRFPGQYYDQETGLHYNYFRDYDPSTGRYIASDPIGLKGGLNTYTYVGNNPVNYTDSTGLVIDTVIDVVSLGLSVQAYKDDPSLTNGLGLTYDALATAIPGLPAGFGIIKNVGSKACKVASPNQLNKQIQRGLAPKEVQRVDIGKVIGEQTHVHFDDGSALNIDGTWKHGESDLSNSVKDWLQSNGWTTPK